MGLLSYTELCELVEQGVISAPLSQVNGCSIDLTLDNVIMIEGEGCFVDLSVKQNISMSEYEIEEQYCMKPGEFILASTREVFNLPNYIAAEYVLKSSMARNGLNNMLAGFCDPGWHNSKLTLELKNETQRHNLIIKPGIPIGQMKFYRVTPVPSHADYAVKGQYNNQSQVTASLGIR